MMPDPRSRSCFGDATKPPMWPNVGSPEVVTPPPGGTSGGRPDGDSDGNSGGGGQCDL
jgi:hypothetical protein